MSRSISKFFSEGREADQLVAITGNRTIDLRQFHRDVAANAARLRQIGCRRGLLGCTDTYWAAVGLLSLFHAGASVVMPQNMRPDSLAMIDDHWDCVISDVARDSHHHVVGLVTADSDQPALPSLHPTDCHLDLFTSGSTGQPKRVKKTLDLLEREASAIEHLLGPQLSAGAQIHATVSHQHLYGLTFGLIWPLFAGRPFHGETHEVWETVLAADIGNSILITSPAHLTRLSGLPEQSKMKQPALIMSAGSPLPADAVGEVVAILSIAPTEIFGSTETGAIAWRQWQTPDPAWSPLPGVRVGQLADGRMSVVSPFIAGDGYHESADLILLAKDGSFRALGRSDDIIKIEGKRVSLSEIETQLRQLPSVSAAAVVVLPGHRSRLGAAVVPSEQGKVLLDAIGSFRFGQLLRRQLAARLESVVLPKHWRFIAEMPSRGLGKRQVTDLLKLFQEVEDMSTPARPNEPELRGKRKTANGVELDLFIPIELSQLEGHFPNLPIVPGVAQIDWAAKYAARHLQLGDGVAMSFQVKFRHLMSPGNNVTLELSHQAERHRLAFTYRQQDQVLASGSFALGMP